MALNLSAQHDIQVRQIKASPLIPVYLPVIIDSTNVEKKKFEEKELLKTAVNFKDASPAFAYFDADTAGVVELSFADAGNLTATRNNKALQVLSFDIDADRYCKATLSVTSTDMLEIYVNRQLEKTKDTHEDSLSKSKAISIDLTLEPRRYEVVIKRLVGEKNASESKLKAVVVSAADDSAAQITVSVDAQRRMTIYDVLEGNRLSGNAGISPSGKYFICGNTTTFPDGKRTSNLELRETASNKTAYRFPPEIAPRWMRGKDYLIYTRQGLTQKDIYQLDAKTLKEEIIAEDIAVNGFSLSPDNRFLCFTKSEEIPADKGDLKRVLAPSDRSGAFRGRSSLYLYSFDTKTTQRLTFGHTSVSLEDVSFDSKKLLFMTHESRITERPFSKLTLYELDLPTRKVDTLFSDAFMRQARYSPDAQQLLIIGGAEIFGGIGLNIKAGQTSNMYDHQAILVDRKTLEKTPITRTFNPAISSVQWSAYDKQIYFSVEDKDRTQVYAYDPKKMSFKKLKLPEDMVRGFSLAEQAPAAIFQGEGTNNAFRLYSYNLRTEQSVLLSDPFKKQLDELALSRVVDWNFTASDGTTIEGHYYLPHNFDSGKKYPMIVYYYGGTAPTPRAFEFSYPLQVYAALGYVVYTLQPSGTTGYGQEFSARHVNTWGIQTADDIIQGTQLFYREHAFVDSTKVGCIGASYGGFMTQYLQTKTDIFAAAVSHAGISNITSYWGEGFWGFSYSAAASAFSYPWNNRQLYTEQSPLFHADKINTPLLLLHGSVDTNVPIGESIQMYNALKILGKPVEFITVEGENHGISDYKKRIEWNKTIYAWFAKWLKDQPEWWEALYPERHKE